MLPISLVHKMVLFLHPLRIQRQCKWRNGKVVLDADNVALYERAKNDEGNLCFTFRGFDAEAVPFGSDKYQ